MYYWDFEMKKYELVCRSDWPSTEMFKKDEYVEKYLTPSVKHANCGWNHCKYFVFKNEDGFHEFVELCPGTEDTGGRYYKVDGLNNGGIAESIWGGVFH